MPIPKFKILYSKAKYVYIYMYILQSIFIVPEVFFNLLPFFI